MDIKYLIASAVCSVALWGAYSTGYDNAETEANLRIEKMKLEQAKEIINAQEKERKKYEQKENELVSHYNSERERITKRMQQLERKLHTSTDMETIRNERSRCFELAVRGEALLGEAERIIKSLK